MKTAYIQTINDFKTALSNTNWWEFKRIYYLQKKIKHYEELLNEHLTIK